MVRQRFRGAADVGRAAAARQHGVAEQATSRWSRHSSSLRLYRLALALLALTVCAFWGSVVWVARTQETADHPHARLRLAQQQQQHAEAHKEVRRRTEPQAPSNDNLHLAERGGTNNRDDASNQQQQQQQQHENNTTV